MSISNNANVNINANKMPSVDKLASLLAAARAKRDAERAALEILNASDATNNLPINTLATNDDNAFTDRNGNLIYYNEQQLAFMRVAGTGSSAVLIGAAGTGKTTCMKGVVETLILSGRVGLLSAEGHKTLPDGTPGIVAVSFTRRAVANLRRNMPEDMKANCLTIHALLEYSPVYYEIFDEATGENKKTMRFEATRHAMRPLPPSIKCCFIDESSMVSVAPLFKELQAALPANCQFIFLGDIQQLPPVFGAAILGYKMLELPTTELTQVYRQALESPIIRLAHRILSGKPIPASEYSEWHFPGKLKLHPWKKKISADDACLTAAKFLKNAIDAGEYNPDEDMILIPFNKSFGTIEINKHIAQHMSKKRGALVYEIIAGFNKSYLSVGDRIMYDKEDAVITAIAVNGAYTGAKPQTASKTLDYWGYDGGNNPEVTVIKTKEQEEEDVDFLLSQVISNTSEDRVRQASHIITVELLDSGNIVELNTASELNNLLLSFALTVHKSQGSEYRKVFLLLHQSHATMIQRELLYTAVTRAREELYVICEPESFTSGIKSQRIKGNTLAEKAEYFKGKLEREV